MTLEILIVLLVIFLTIYSFLTEVVSYDLTAVLCLSLFIILRYIEPNQVFIGFSSPAVITLASMFIIGAGIKHSGSASLIADFIFYISKGHKSLTLFLFCISTAIISAFISNVAIVAVLLPAASELSSKIKLPLSKILIPMSFSAILGGTLTIIGTAANVLMPSLMQQVPSLTPFSFGSYFSLGVLVLVAGLVTIFLSYDKLLPENKNKFSNTESNEIENIYKLSESLFNLKVEKSSPLIGASLGSSKLSEVLGVRVVSIIRNNSKIQNLKPTLKIQDSDELICFGKLSKVKSILKLSKLKISEMEFESVFPGIHIEEFEIVTDGFNDLKVFEIFNNKYHPLVIVQREAEIFLNPLSKVSLQKSDILHVLTDGSVNSFQGNKDFKLVKKHQNLKEYPFRGCLKILTSSDFLDIDGLNIAKLNFSKYLLLKLLTIKKNNKEIIFNPVGEDVLSSGDLFLVSGDFKAIENLDTLNSLGLKTDLDASLLKLTGGMMIEAIVPPRSDFIGKSLIDLDFKKNTDFDLIAVSRQGRLIRTNLPNYKFKEADCLILLGAKENKSKLISNTDFIFLGEQSNNFNFKKAMISSLTLLLVVLFSAFSSFPVSEVTFLGAVICLLTKVISIEQAYKEISWKILIIIACLLPVGSVFETSGTSAYLTELLYSVISENNPFVLVVVLCLLASILSQVLDSAIALVLLFPIAVSIISKGILTAEQLLLPITIATSINLLTPFSNRANILIMSAGGYKFSDYFKIGAVVSIVCFFVLFLGTFLIFF